MVSGLSSRSDRLTDLDYALGAAANALTAIALGIGLSNPSIGYFFAIGSTLGSIFSALWSRLRMTESGFPIDSYLYFVASAVALVGARQLNYLLPEQNIPRELMISVTLSWMVVFGSIVSWSYSTLLFQLIPCISIFALVGVYDTFQGAPMVFFAFLICASILYARAHYRTMLRRAEESGYTDVATIRKGPWRWVAGPEWALGSAFLVVLISLLGAPIVQSSVQGVAGVVNVSPPRMRTRVASTIGSAYSPGSMRVGVGPRKLTEEVVFRIKLDRPRHLRTATYAEYSQSNWTLSSPTSTSELSLDLAVRRKPSYASNFEIVEFQLSPESAMVDKVPVPGFVLSLHPALSWSIRADGTVTTRSGIPANGHVLGRSSVLRSGVSLSDTPLPIPKQLWPYADPAMVPDSIASLAERACAGRATDYEKALAIKAEIESRCTYNLAAEPAPTNRDAVSHFLFGEKKEGYCDLFASAMALMARSQGIPARLATGYFPASGDLDSRGRNVIRESDAHAWAELYFEGAGWIPFDATEGANSVPGFGRGDPTNSGALIDQPWFRWFTGALIGMAALLGLGFLFAGGRADAGSRTKERQELARAYGNFTRELETLSKRPRSPSETPFEYVQAVSPHLHGLSGQVERLCRRFEAAFYSREEMSKELVAELESGVRALTSARKLQRRRTAM